MPGKRKGAPVVCPVCEHRFLPKSGGAAVESSADSNSSSSNAGSSNADLKTPNPTMPKPSMRSLPLPAGMKPPVEKANEPVQQTAHQTPPKTSAIPSPAAAKTSASQADLGSLLPPGKGDKSKSNPAAKPGSISEAAPPPRKMRERESADDFVDAEPEPEPKNEFDPPVEFALPELTPKKELFSPVVFERPENDPKKELKFPVVFNKPERFP